MDIDTFWDIIETARAQSGPGRPIDQALAGCLAARSRGDILGFQQRFDELHTALYRWDVWAAAYLIGGGCSDDGFLDFRAGIIAQGRDWYEQAAASPDSLADHPAVADAAARAGDDALFFEEFAYAARAAFEQATGDKDIYGALDRDADSGGDPDFDPDPAGDDFDFDDDKQMRQRLPRLAALYLPADLAGAE